MSSNPATSQEPGKESTDAFPDIKLRYGAMSEPVPQPPPVKLVLDSYKSDHERRGKCFIINNRDFNEMLTGQKNRVGTDQDAESLESAFCGLGFDVIREDNLTTTDMSIKLRMVAEEEHWDADCFVCIILSHGKEGVVYGTNGTIKIDSLLRNFKGDVCPSLAGKPKIFIIQACRGSHFDPGTVVGGDTLDAGFEENPSVRKIPTEADFLIAYSVVPGFFSWRNNVDGSWFIQALVRVLKEYGDTMELQQMMTLVSKVVAYDFQSCTDDDFTSNMKQIPCIVSMLTKQVFFQPKY